MNIQLLSAVQRDVFEPIHNERRPWPPRVMLTGAAWVRPGDRACVTLLTLHGKEDQVELPWGIVDPVTGELDFQAHSEGKSFARPCLIIAQQVVQDCDVGDRTDAASICFAVRAPGAFAGMWIAANSHVYQPVAFKILMAPAGPDLAPYCTRQPVLIPTPQFRNWLNPTVSTKGLQHAPDAGTFEVLGVTPRQVSATV
jgi:putative SOS response-associated peptidase YedK